jgi:DNA-binding MarR family transcriptional regulator
VEAIGAPYRGRLERRRLADAVRAREEAIATAPPVAGPFVRAVIAARRLRTEFFEAQVAAGAEWNILLHLYAERIEGRPVSITHTCAAAQAPATSALRAIARLEAEKLIARSRDPQDARRVFLNLSADAARRMGAYLAALQGLGAARL